MNDYREQVTLALRAVAVRSPTSHSWFGRASRPLPRPVRSALPAGAAREFLVERLQQELYRSFYTQGRPVPRSPEGAPAGQFDRAFVEALSKSNSGTGSWEPGWRVEEDGHGSLVAAKNGLRVRIDASDCRPASGAPTALNVRRPKEHRAASPGFYTALGDAHEVTGDGDVELRVYFNVTASGAAPLVKVCTRLLNHAAIPFSLKVLDQPERFSRCDTAVLYVRDRDFHRLREPLRAIVSACRSHLRESTPALAKPLTRGVAVGEHRQSLGGSFGTSRCRMISEGIVDAHERRATGLSDRLAAVARRFADRGLDLDIPYLVPPSEDRYAL